ncbi:GNAT family N-acetyltransferase [Acidithiobacillus sp. M4-SHS-6]|uniref:GNAT family N-acetyltransferase n=1 Tax=Acidithiobacillus sp. M4-SHS-6 TaxID=3383024 RepID=UPI0039BE8036
MIAAKSHADEIHDFILRVAKSEVFPRLGLEGQSYFESTLRQDIEQILMRDGGTYLVCFGSELIGVCGFRHSGHVNHLFVAPEACGKGVGRILLQQACDYIAGPIIDLNASLNSIGFYTRLGFEAVGSPQSAHGVKYQHMSLVKR